MTIESTYPKRQGPSEVAYTSSPSQQTSPILMEPNSSLPFSQQRTSFPYSDIEESSPRTLNRLINFILILSSNVPPQTV
jgi:hypothetical protein